MRYLHQFVGSRRLARASAQINAAAAQWSAQWRVDHADDPLTVTVVAAAPDAAAASSDGADWADWAALVFGSAEAQLPADDTRSALLAAARSALIDLLVAAPGTASAAAPEPIPPADGRARVAAMLAGSNATVRVLLDASHYDSALPAAAKKNWCCATP